MYDDYNYRLNMDCCVYDDPFIKCEKCGALCKEFDLENGVCADCVEEGEVNNDADR